MGRRRHSDMDSDDDGDRRGRDKFARERDYSDRRRDDDRRPYRNDYSNGNKRSASNRRDDGPKRSRMDSDSVETRDDTLMSFKRFMTTLDDSVSDEEAISKYSEYKLQFKKQQLQKFFDAHKEEEWFRLKYHPEESTKRKEEHQAAVKRRLEVFDEFRSKGVVGDISLDMVDARKIIFLMDAVAVKLEGGTDEDVQALKTQKVEDECLRELEEKTEEDRYKQELQEAAKKTEEETEEENGSDAGKKKKMQLHKTFSVFLRNIDPSVTTAEVESVCKRSPGFLRVCLSEPVPDKKFARRGWATYRRDVNIKEITWNINSIRIRETDLHAIINKDITRKVRSANGITTHKAVAQNDIRLAAKLVAFYDLRAGLFTTASEEERERDIQLGVDLVGQSKNPIFNVVRRHMGEELSPEEEELLGISRSSTKVSDDSGKTAINRDNDLLKALDLLILYLRIVHSFDYYYHGEYAQEDIMPNRCGILHVRGIPENSSLGDSDADGVPLFTNKFINEYIANTTKDIEKTMVKEFLAPDEINKLGKKDPEEEVENFIVKNTVELAKEKWLCPLSGKKFKGPEFIRKHLLSKHNEALDKARMEAAFFNNFLSDPSRPSEPEDKTPAVEERRHDDRPYNDRPRYSGGRGYGGGGYGRDDRRPPPPRYYDGGEARRDPRAPLTYRDLDAPETDIA